jgi:hypothetical protein
MFRPKTQKNTKNEHNKKSIKNHRKTPIISRLFALMIHENQKTSFELFWPETIIIIRQSRPKSTFPNREEHMLYFMYCCCHLLKPYQIAINNKLEKFSLFCIFLWLLFIFDFIFSSVVLLLLFAYSLLSLLFYNDYSITKFWCCRFVKSEKGESKCI